MGENNMLEGNARPRRNQLAAAVVPLVGVIGVLVGCIVVVNSPATFGWFSYAPLSNERFMGNGVTMVSQGQQIGWAVAVAGLLVLAFWAGYRLGKRRSRSES